MKKDKDLSKRQVDFLSNNFFGKLIVEFTCNELTSYYEGEITKKEYKIIKRDGNYITIRYFENGLGEDCDYTIELAGDCYYIPLPILKFREVMCRIKEWASNLYMAFGCQGKNHPIDRKMSLNE